MMVGARGGLPQQYARHDVPRLGRPLSCDAPTHGAVRETCDESDGDWIATVNLDFQARTADPNQDRMALTLISLAAEIVARTQELALLDEDPARPGWRKVPGTSMIFCSGTVAAIDERYQQIPVAHSRCAQFLKHEPPAPGDAGARRAWVHDGKQINRAECIDMGCREILGENAFAGLRPYHARVAAKPGAADLDMAEATLHTRGGAQRRVAAVRNEWFPNTFNRALYQRQLHPWEGSRTALRAGRAERLGFIPS